MNWKPTGALILGAVALTLVSCGTCGYAIFREPPPKAGIKKGMTATELGRAFPGEYSATIPFDRLPKASEVSASKIAAYHGNVLIKSGNVAAISLDYFEGHRADYGGGPIAHASLEKRLPLGITLTETLKRLGPATDVRLGGYYDSHFSIDLPRDAARLHGYDGSLLSSKPFGWDSYHFVSVKMRNGKVTEVKERDSHM